MQVSWPFVICLRVDMVYMDWNVQMCKSYRMLHFNGPCSIMMKVVHDMICVSFVWVWAYQILSICFKLEY